MEAVFVHEGTSIDYTPGSDVAAGEVVVQGDLVGVAKGAVLAGGLGALDVAGVFSFAKAAGVLAVGTKVYWDNTTKVATSTASTHKLIGKVAYAAADGDTTVDVRMNQ